MSLRSVHAAVIVAAILTLLGFGFLYRESYRAWAAVSLILGTALIPYLFWFLKKSAKLS